MKTNLEWIQYELPNLSESDKAHYLSHIADIQKDAWIQGMTDAAKCCEGWVLANDARNYILKKRNEDKP